MKKVLIIFCLFITASEATAGFSSQKTLSEVVKMADTIAVVNVLKIDVTSKSTKKLIDYKAKYKVNIQELIMGKGLKGDVTILFSIYHPTHKGRVMHESGIEKNISPRKYIFIIGQNKDANGNFYLLRAEGVDKLKEIKELIKNKSNNEN